MTSTSHSPGAAAGLDLVRELTFLRDVRVVELGTSLAVASAGALLRRFGADVATVAIAPSVDREPVRAVDRLRSILAEGKEVVAADGWRANIDAADIVLCDRSGSLPDELCVPASTYLRRIEELNSSVWVTVSPFGLTGLRADDLASETVMVAAGGLLHHTARFRAGARPVKPAGHQAMTSAGDVAAIAALHMLDVWRTDGTPVHAEVSIQEAVIALGTFFECAHRLLECPGHGGSGRYSAPSGTFPCRDGEVFISTLEDHQWQGILASMGRPAWAEEIRTAEDRLANQAVIDARMAEWTKDWEKDACAALLQENGVPATPVQGPSELTLDPQFRAREFWCDGVRPRTGVPARVWHGDGTTGTARSARIAGLRILDISQVLGPPLAGAWLGVMGADVVKVEDPDRLETYRRNGPFADGVRDIERSAYFSATNHTKRGVTASFQQLGSSDEFASLIAWPDVLIENWSLSRATRAGLGPELIRQRRADLLMVSSSGFGREGPLASWRAYGHNLHAYSGLTYLTRDEQNVASDVGTPWADPLTAAFLTVFIAAAATGGWSGFWWADTSMAEILSSHFAEFVAMRSGGWDDDAILDQANADQTAAASFVIRCAGEDRWLAVSPTDEAQFAALVDVLRARGGGSVDAASIAPQGREPFDLQAALRVLDGACGALNAQELAAELQRVGVPACEVLRPADLIDDRHLIERDFFPTLEHPVMGSRRFVAIPWRMAGSGPFQMAPAPTLGQHNDDLPLERVHCVATTVGGTV